MGPMPDRFLAYLIEGEREPFVIGDGAIARHERQQALGSVGAIQLLAEGGPLAPEVVMRVARLLRALAAPWGGLPARTARFSRAPEYQVDAMAAPFEGALDLDRQAAFAGLREISGQSRPRIALAANSPPQRARATGLEVIVRAGLGDGGRKDWLELELQEAGDAGRSECTALVWSSPEDPQRARFDPAGIARLHWPAAARSTLRIDAGAYTALFDLLTTT